MRSELQAEIKRKAALYAGFSSALREPVPTLPERKTFNALWRGLKMGGEPIPLPADPKDIEGEFRNIFGHNLSPDCPPYETHYGKIGVFRKNHILADLAGFYRAFGLETAQGDRRVDHLPVQLEFASLLLHKEALALDRGEEEKAETCRKAREKLLHEHLAVWIPVFAKAVELKEVGGYFAAIVRRLAAFVAWDAASTCVKPQNSKAAPSGPDAEETPCSTCLGGSDEKI